jgi:carbon monoxide dehydrogenase subunit G
VPGVETVEAVDDRAYRGCLKVQVGPIRLALEGMITVEAQDQNAWHARMRAEATDRRLGGGIRARLGLTLAAGEEGTHLKIDTDLAILGKIGEFGQPVIKKKADTILAEFARNLQSALAV